jgi:acyl dehydratase
MAMYLHRVGATTAPSRHTWTPAACALYALALGAGVDEVEFTVDGAAEQQVYPTFVFAAVLAAEAAGWPDPALATGNYRIGQLVLGEQSLRLHGVVPTHGDVCATTTVAGIYDKGSGALVALETRAVDNRTQSVLFTATSGVFVIGEGGFGGDRGASGSNTKQPDRQPNVRLWYPTSPAQTLLYRYAGNDRNPIHSDVDTARAAGYREPILMGQNTLGFACRALVHSVAGGEAARLRSISGRFAEAGYNGDLLSIEIWVGDDIGVDDNGHAVALFRVLDQHRRVLIDRGRATLA